MTISSSKFWSFSIAQVPPQDEDKSTVSEATTPATDWFALFQMHYANRVKAFKEQNQPWQNVVLVGDSITEGFDVATYFAGRRVLNRGIGGDVIGNALPAEDQRGVLRRMDESIFDCGATHVFLMIGVNDLNGNRKPAVMAEGYREILNRIKATAPRTKVYVTSVLPTRGEHAERNADIADFNVRIRALAQEFDYPYLDLHSLMADDQRQLKAELTADGLHLLAPAYAIWRREIERAMGWDQPTRNREHGTRNTEQ